MMMLMWLSTLNDGTKMVHRSTQHASKRFRQFVTFGLFLKHVRVDGQRRGYVRVAHPFRYCCRVRTE